MNVAVFTLIATIILIDQLSKFLILKYIGLNASIDLIKNILSFTPILNTGAGFGIFPNQTFLFIIISIISIIFIAYLIFRYKLKEKFFLYPAALILSGALGNLVDRLRVGAVIDFIDFKIWPVFNIADSCITIGAMIIIWQLLKKR